jgi:predicted AAA+ superfamily ATPase
VGDLEAAIEFKSGRQVRDTDFRGLRALREEHRVGRAIIVARTDEPRTTDDGLEILPWRLF